MVRPNWKAQVRQRMYLVPQIDRLIDVLQTQLDSCAMRLQFTKVDLSNENATLFLLDHMSDFLFQAATFYITYKSFGDSIYDFSYIKTIVRATHTEDDSSISNYNS